ncbi:MAG: hypothetical protein ACE5IY_21380, partial [bacterium]
MKMRRAHLRFWFCLTGCFLLLVPNFVQSRGSGITPEMVVSLERVRQAALDPSGQKVAFVLSVPRDEDDKPGRAYSEIWVTSLDGGEPVQYTSKPV